MKSTYFTKYNKHIKSLQSTISNMLVIANKQRTSFTNVENISNTLWNGKNTKYFENVWHSHVVQFLIILVTSTTPIYSRKMPSYTADMISKVQDWTGRIMQMWCHIWIVEWDHGSDSLELQMITMNNNSLFIIIIQPLFKNAQWNKHAPFHHH